MKELRNVVVGIVVLVVAVNVLTGHTAGITSFVIGLLADVTRSLQTVLIAVALPALLLGGLIYVSPWQRDLAVRLMVGAGVVLAVAVLARLRQFELASPLQPNTDALFEVSAPWARCAVVGRGVRDAEGDRRGRWAASTRP